MVCGSPRHSESNGGVERVNRTVQAKLGTWMQDTNSRRWSIGCRIVMWRYNTQQNLLNSLATEAELNQVIDLPPIDEPIPNRYENDVAEVDNAVNELVVAEDDDIDASREIFPAAHSSPLYDDSDRLFAAAKSSRLFDSSNSDNNLTLDDLGMREHEQDSTPFKTTGDEDFTAWQVFLIGAK